MGERRLQRREGERQRHRKEILNVALDLFSEKGFNNVTMHEIANKADFSIGTMYKYFENKEALYRALILGKAEQFHSVIKNALKKKGDVLEKIHNCITAVGNIFRENVSVIRLYFAETHGASFNMRAGLEGDVQEYYLKSLHETSKVFARGIEEGIFKAYDPFYMALALEGIINSFLFCWLEDQENQSFEENIPLIEEILLKGVLNENGRKA